MTSDEAAAFAATWIDDWNRHDLDAIVAHYADPPHHTSPLVVARTGRDDGTITDLGELRDYFARGLAASPPLRFTLLAAFPGIATLALLYRNHRDRLVVEVMHLDDDGKVSRSIVHDLPAVAAPILRTSSV